MTTPLSIAILCHPTYGGSGVVASELAISLAEAGHEVHLFSSAVPPRLARAFHPVQMHVAQGAPYPLFQVTPHDLAITSAVLTQHRTSGLDVIHAHYALPHAVSAYLARQAARADGHGRPPALVTTLHGTDITLVGNAPSYAPLTQFVISESDAVTAVSEDLARRTRENFCPDSGFRPCAIRVIPNFVDVELFHPDAGRGVARQASFEAVHVSNFRPVKRVPWMLRAFARALELGGPGPKPRLTLVGDGPDRDPACELARSLGLGEHVRFLGERDALPELLAPADLFLLASSEESFGLSALEAMACGTPVLATRVGGIPEVVDHERTGLLVEADDLEGYARALARVVAEPELAERLGTAARRAAVERFAREHVIGRYVALYRELLERAPAEARDPAPGDARSAGGSARAR